MKVRKLRLLREKHGITARELACACGLSAQRICEIETTAYNITPATVRKLKNGFNAIARKRRAGAAELETDMDKHGATLCEYVEETDYEL